MGYKVEGQRLLDETKAKHKALIEKYKDYQNPGMLDGEPWAEEERQLFREYSAGLEALREKYPDWRSELE